MKKWGLSQEWLKLIACVTMLIDHMGAALLPQYLWMRVIGRIAFPIYCFLIAEGMHYTRNPRKYSLRLGIGAILSEIPFDLALFGMITLRYQSVMLTLLIGVFMADCVKRVRHLIWRIPIVVPFALFAEWLCTDYGGMGVVLIALFVLTRELPKRLLIQTAGMAVIFYLMDSYVMTIGGVRIPIEMFAMLSLIPIGLYSGRKLTGSKAAQWAFYLFYPIHLMTLFLITWLL